MIFQEFLSKREGLERKKGKGKREGKKEKMRKMYHPII
jgi:hypothetical protein